MLARILRGICSVEGCQRDYSVKLFLSSVYNMLIHIKRNCVVL